MKKRKCAFCEKEIDVSKPFGHENEMEEGALTVCFYCRGVSMLQDGEFIKPPQDVLDDNADQLQEIEQFLNQVPKIRESMPSTLGTYRMIAEREIGPYAVQLVDDLIQGSDMGESMPVRVEYNSMMGLLETCEKLGEKGRVMKEMFEQVTDEE